jgi:Hemerythrin HHE cation binding domain
LNPTLFRNARRLVLEQHDEIRARLHGLAEMAGRVSLPSATHALRTSLLRLARRFDAHLAYEERELVPLVRALDAWGPEREAAILVEHREQRGRLERVCALAEDPEVDPLDLVDEVWAFIGEIVEDMISEEGMLAELAELAEHGHLDQMTG